MYILDDPFGTLDKKVAKQIMDKCILGFLKGKTIVLITHQTEYLLHVDSIYHLNEGQCIEKKKSGITMEQTTDKFDCEMNLNKSIDDNEEVSRGGLSGLKTYAEYFKSGSLSLFFSYLFLFVITFCTKIYLDKLTSNFGIKEWNGVILLFIFVIILLIVLLETARQFIYQINIGVCSINLHNNMFSKIMSAPVQFFHDNPKGRILNRFSRDLGYVDSLLHLYLELVIIIAGGIIISIGLVISSVPIVIVPTLIFGVILCYT